MTPRTRVLAVVTASALAIVVWQRTEHRAPVPTAVPIADASPRASTRPPQLRAAAARPADADGPVSRIEGSAFAEAYAGEMCACRDGACADAVDESYRRRLGTVLPDTDGQRTHDAYEHVRSCRRHVALPPTE